MLFAIVFMSAIFGIIGLSVTKNNARYLLSGYNTMSEEERANVDIDRYIPYFRKFHLYLAGSFLVLGSLLNFLSASSAGFFLIFFPMSAYTYFIFKSQKFYGVRKHRVLVPIIIFLVVMIFVASFFLMGLREDILIIRGETLE